MTTSNKNLLIFIILFFLTITIYGLTGVGNTKNDHFIRLAQSFIQGHLYLKNPPSYLELTGKTGDRIRYVPYPPMPAIVAVPFVVFNIADKSQTFISTFLGSINVGLFFLLCQRWFKKVSISLALALTLGFGTDLWYLASGGSSWYIAHVLTIFFLIIALLAIDLQPEKKLFKISQDPRRWFLAGLLVGAAYWSRLPAIISLIFFIALSLSSPNKTKLRQIIPLFLGASIFIFLDFGYNYLRFGTIWDVAYEKIQGVLQESWYDHGIFSLYYLPRNLKFFFFQPPLFQSSFPYLKPSLIGMSFFLTSPIFLLLPFIKWKESLPKAALLTAGLMLIPGLLHGTPGFTQFGYRFAAESTPFFLIALGSALKRPFIWPIALFLIALSVAINFWGIYFIRFLGIYS